MSRKSNFCKPCEVSVMQSAPAIVEIAEEHETFKSGAFVFSPVSRMGCLIPDVVAQQFKNSWRHGVACPTVRAIYKVVSTQQSVDKYNLYRFVVSHFPHTRHDPYSTQLQRFCGSPWPLHRQ